MGLENIILNEVAPAQKDKRHISPSYVYPIILHLCICIYVGDFVEPGKLERSSGEGKKIP